MQWEYYRLATVESCLDEALQELGLDGWELVSIMTETRLFHGFQCLLKRPRTADPERGKTPALPPRYQKLMSVR
jgi:hypothetical protein